MMTIDEIREVLLLVREHELVEFELERDGMKLRIRKDSVHAPVPHTSVVTPAAAPAMAPVAAPAAAPSSIVSAPVTLSQTELEEAVELAVVKSPIVGTFYRSPSPGAPAIIEIGTVVKKGQILCIIEAMKLMNEIESEYDGEVVKIYVESGQPVQYGERLFAIKAG